MASAAPHVDDDNPWPGLDSYSEAAQKWFHGRDADSAELLGCEPGAPVLAIGRLTFTPAGRAVESTRLLFVGDRYEYRVELHRPALGERQ